MIRSDAAAPGLRPDRRCYGRRRVLQSELRTTRRGGISALPLLEKAAASVAIAPDDDPIVIADFGSSQGRNSLLPLSTAIKSLRRRLGVDRPISVFHTDQPGNDFSTLFQVVHTDPDSYLETSRTYLLLLPASLFMNRFFAEHDHARLEFLCVDVPSQLAALIPGHIFSTRSSDAVLAAFNKRGDDDWRRFLSLRATELRTGGRLVIVIAARGDEGLNGMEPLMDHANAVLLGMVKNRTISAAERERIVVPAHPKSLHDLLAPFAGKWRFHGLAMEHCEVFPDHTQCGTITSVIMTGNRWLFTRPVFSARPLGRHSQVPWMTIAPPPTEPPSFISLSKACCIELLQILSQLDSISA